MSEIDISMILSLFALFISTIHIVFDKWLDRWFEKRDRNKIHEELTQKITRFSKSLTNDVKGAELSTEEHLKYLKIINEKFFKLTPILLNATYSVERMKEVEYELDQFFLDLSTELGARIIFKAKEEITQEE